ncbi:MAG TPA: phosphoadenosine phosphosulfate reductase family protein, partial [Tepidisphaeraceae bacterium]|nr:phosphoadenosine phosphosulfate reductase family protein [Tepidisphaeraceae bacterium]
MATIELNLEDVNTVLEAQDPPRILDWAAREFGDEVIMSSSFGSESAVLIHLATQVLPRIRIVMVDTGYLFPETHQFMESLRRRFDLNV